MFNYSLKTIIRKDRVNKEGLASLSLRITINRKRTYEPLNLKWKVDKFDELKGQCKPSKRGCKDYQVYNLKAEELKEKANEIIRYYLLSKQVLTIDQFKKEFRGKSSKINVLKFIEYEINERFRKKEISKRTKATHNQTLNKLKDYAPNLIFNEITLSFVQEFHLYITQTCKLGHNTAYFHHKVFRTYLRIALSQKIPFEYPYDDFNIQMQPTDRQALSMSDLKLLTNLYREQSLSNTFQGVLRQFLFCCYTGLRHSDVRYVTYEMIENNTLTFIMRKNQKRKPKKLSIPLNSIVYNFMKSENATGKIFPNPISEQKTNLYLKEIIKDAGIDKKITFHSSRDTFATIAIELGINPVILQELLGHSTFEMTRRYIKLHEEAKQKAMNAFDAFND